MNRPRRRERGLTLLEILVSISILAFIGMLIYGAFDGMQRTQAGIARIDERYHQGRSALARMSRELQAAFLSLHQPLAQSQSTRLTAFLGKNQGSADRLDFASFSHRRLGQNRHESDQNELGYFVSRDPDRGDKQDLVRRESAIIDLDPIRGGVVNVLAEDIESFDLRYLDPLTGQWLDAWDSTQTTGQLYRLPLQVRIELTMRGGIGGQPIKLVTKVTLPSQVPITFASPVPLQSLLANAGSSVSTGMTIGSKP